METALRPLAQPLELLTPPTPAITAAENQVAATGITIFTCQRADKTCYQVANCENAKKCLG
jgi:hypothetical protein